DDADLVDGDGLDRRQRLGLARHQGERAAVLPALDLALVGPDLALGEGEVGVAAAVAHRVEVVADADEGDAVLAHVEALGRARLDVVDRAQADGGGGHHWLTAAAAGASSRDARRREMVARTPATSDGLGSRSRTSPKKPMTMRRSAATGGTPRLSR